MARLSQGPEHQIHYIKSTDIIINERNLQVEASQLLRTTLFLSSLVAAEITATAAWHDELITFIIIPFISTWKANAGNALINTAADACHRWTVNTILRGL